MTPPLSWQGWLKLLAGLLLGLLFLSLLDLLLSVHEGFQALSSHLSQLHQRARQAPDWVWLTLAFFLGLLLTGLVHWRKRPPPPPAAPLPVDETGVQARIERNRAAGAEVEEALAELRRLADRRQGGEVHLALLAEVNAGKSTLIQALLPGARVETSVVGGTTREVTHYQWRNRLGDRVLLTDSPGLNEAGGALSALALEEAARAQIVLYLVAADLTRSQGRTLEALLALGKPVIVAVNKQDLYDQEERQLLEGRMRARVKALRENLPEAPEVAVAFLSAGGTRQVRRRLDDGREVLEERAVPPRVERLQAAILRILDHDPAQLDRLRDRAVFTLAAGKLDAAWEARRRQQAEEVIRRHTRRAVAAAMASVTPGLDLVLQGAVAFSLVRELARLHQITLEDVRVADFLKVLESRLSPTLPALLAIAGNVLKAFPGVGTLSGGVLHAVAYGLILESLGWSVARTLAERGELTPRPALILLEEHLCEDLPSRAKRLVQTALEGERSGDSP